MVADIPARAFIKSTISHSGKHIMKSKGCNIGEVNIQMIMEIIINLGGLSWFLICSRKMGCKYLQQIFAFESQPSQILNI